jgi:hypothetical protein
MANASAVLSSNLAAAAMMASQLPQADIIEFCSCLLEITAGKYLVSLHGA